MHYFSKNAGDNFYKANSCQPSILSLFTTHLPSPYLQALKDETQKEQELQNFESLLSFEKSLKGNNVSIQANCGFEETENYIRLPQEKVEDILRDKLKITNSFLAFGMRFKDLIAIVRLNKNNIWEHYNSHPGRSTEKEKFVFQLTYTTVKSDKSPWEMLSATIDSLKVLYPTGKVPNTN